MQNTAADHEDTEARRLKALELFAIMDTPPEHEFDEIARIAAAALDVDHCAVSLIDGHRQWFKACVGIDVDESARADSFCTHAVEQRSFLEVSDARLDPRFTANPFVTGEVIRFYAGAPLIVQGGHCLGTLCVFDPEPRAKLSEREIRLLQDLAKLTSDLLDARRTRRISEVACMVVEATSDAILCVDLQGRITFWNGAAERMFGHSAGEVAGRTLDVILPPAHAAAHHSGFAHAAAGGPTTLVGSMVELSAVRATGEEFPIELSLARWGVGDEGGFAAIVRDITGRKRLERDRKHAETFLDTIISHLPAMLFVKDAETRRYLLVNRAGEKMIGRPADQIVGQTDRELFPRVGMTFEERDTHALHSDGVDPHESEFEREDGETFSLRTRRIMIAGPDAPRQYILGLSEDVTEIRRSEARVLHLAHYDSLTGLRNRASLDLLMEELVAAGTRMAILSIDLDRFKAVNDQFGHLIGDEVLAMVGRRLAGVARAGDIVARIGGDEFIIITVDDNPAVGARRIARAVLDALRDPIATSRAQLYIGASIGVVVAPEDGGTTYDLRQHADLALYRGKAEQRGSVCFFSREMDAEAQERRTLERDLIAAIHRREIELAYQPVMAAATGRMTSVEALARWTHPERGQVPPDIFIPLAEEAGLIGTLGAYLLEQACMAAATWPAHIRIAVNLSPLQFDGGDLVAIVRRALRRSGLAAERLQLEVTEGLLIRDADRTFATLARLRTLGIQILMDDFGVGYSSLSYFERFPFDKVKIDRSFVRDLATSKAARAIVHAVVGLGTTLGMGIVAEGVETEDQRRALVEAGCTHLQGFLFGRPLAIADLRDAIAQEMQPLRLMG